MKKFLFLSLLFGLGQICIAQDYSDIVVLINSNSEESIAVGEYFQNTHDIFDDHVFYLDMPTDELIDSLAAEDIIDDIQNRMDSLELIGLINYFVTTLDCPKGVDFLNSPDNVHLSFENALAIQSLEIGAANPYKNFTNNFSFNEYGIYLVSRLEAGDLNKTFDLIDRGGFQDLNNVYNNVIIDVFHTFIQDSTLLEIFQHFSEMVAESLAEDGIDAEVDLEGSHYIGDFKGIGYLIYGQGGLNSGVPNVDVSEITGVASMVMTYSADHSNDDILNVYHFLNENCFGAIGGYQLLYVAVFNAVQFYSQIFDLTVDMNLAECYFSSYASFIDSYTLFGDPKSQIMSLNFITSTQELESADELARVYPNPIADILNIELANQIMEAEIELYNVKGKRLISLNTDGLHQIRHNVSNLNPGIYILKIKSEIVERSIQIIKI